MISFRNGFRGCAATQIRVCGLSEDSPNVTDFRRGPSRIPMPLSDGASVYSS